MNKPDFIAILDWNLEFYDPIAGMYYNLEDCKELPDGLLESPSGFEFEVGN